MSIAENGYPSYLKLLASGELEKRRNRALALLASCSLCPRRCGAKRLDGEAGECGGGWEVKVADFGPHFGEEPPLVGCRGSGTIFFSGCPLHCLYCQNWDISQKCSGDVVSTDELATMMLGLQALGCHNLNLVTPTHYVPQILEALCKASKSGFSLPIVYNTSGYENLSTLRLLDGIIDIYMPDMKYGEENVAARLSKVDDYPATAKAALKEMHRQVGDLVQDERGIARRGMIIRHLVLPSGLSGPGAVMEFIAGEISREAYVNVMQQYRPCYRAGSVEELSRRLSAEEFEKALDEARRAGLRRSVG
jgi:putative pyruvate formate lyase activating enzyme